MSKKPLSYKLKKLLEPCQYWPKEQKQAFMPVVEYAQKLEDKIKRLEDDLKNCEAPTLPSIFGEGQHMSRSFLNYPGPSETVLSLEERVWKGMREGKANDPKFKAMLEWNRITPERAQEIFDKFSNKTLDVSK